MKKTTLVVLGNGQVGVEVARRLAERHRVVRGARQGALRPPLEGTTPVTLDLDKPETFGPALSGVDSMFLAAPGETFQLGPLEALLAAARGAGLERVVLLSAHGVDFRPHPMQGLEAAVKAGPWRWVVLRPNSFMQNLLGPLGAGLRAEGVLREPAGEGATAMVDVRDLAEVAARAFDGGFDGETLTLTGPQALTRRQVVETLSRVTGRTFQVEDVPPPVFREVLLAQGLPPVMADTLSGFYGDIREGRMAAVTGDVARVLGRPATSLEAFATDHRAAFAPR